MKTISLFLICLLSITVNAQDPDPRLFDTQWFLNALTIDGNVIEIPSSNEINDVILLLSEDRFNTNACDSLGSDISSFSDTSFIADSWALLPLGCTQQTTLDFQEAYFETFLKAADFNVPFTYTLEEVGPEGLRLTIMNSDGDTAVYDNPALAITDILEEIVAIYPNPVTDNLTIQLSNGLVAQEIRIYSLQGALVAQKMGSGNTTQTIAMNKLAAGVYFVNVMGVKGRTFVKRVVKE